MTDAPDDMTAAELKQAVRIFSGLYWCVIATNFAAIGVGVYAGYHGWDWRFVVPMWAALWFGLRVLKRYVRDIVTSCQNDLLAQQPPIDEATSGVATDVTVTHHRSSNTLATVLAVAIAMLLVAWFWYHAGRVLARLSA